MKLVKYICSTSEVEVLEEHITFEDALKIVSKIIETSSMRSHRDYEAPNTWCFGYGDIDICKLIIVE